jgi:signal transduction histidine kinase
MRTTAELALRKPRGSGEYREALEEIHAESVRTTDLIENLLTLARADAGKAAFERREVDLGEIVREAGIQGEKLAAAKSLKFHTEAPDRPARILGDAAALRRLLLIVIDNAVKYTQEGGISVCLGRANGDFRVSVSDTGTGIPPDDLPRVFERFYRADKSRSRELGGSGLGLSIAKWIAEGHAGTIEARSGGGNGSTIVITFPEATGGS